MSLRKNETPCRDKQSANHRDSNSRLTFNVIYGRDKIGSIKAEIDDESGILRPDRLSHFLSRHSQELVPLLGLNENKATEIRRACFTALLEMQDAYGVSRGFERRKVTQQLTGAELDERIMKSIKELADKLDESEGIEPGDGGAFNETTLSRAY